MKESWKNEIYRREIKEELRKRKKEDKEDGGWRQEKELSDIKEISLTRYMT